MASHDAEPDWVHGHAHEPNLYAPPGDGSFAVHLPGGRSEQVTVADLQRMPYTEAHRCLIVSTGHGASGPFTFGGVRLADCLSQFLPGAAWRHVDHIDIVSADGFGARILPSDLAGNPANSATNQPILLAYTVDGMPLTRARGLVRLIAPAETDDALRQVKWVSRILLVGRPPTA